MVKRVERRDGDRRRVERRKPRPGVNVRYEDKDQPSYWRPNRMRRAGDVIEDRRREEHH